MTTSNISGPGGVFAGGVPGQSASGAAQSAKGEWNGIKVSVSDSPASLIADAAEELTFAASETVEKKIADRKKPEARRDAARVVPVEETLAEMQRQLQDGKDNLENLLAAFRESGGNPAALKDALGKLGDATSRHAALLWLEEQLAGEPSLTETVRRERETLEAGSAPEIQAGYNLHGVDAGGAEDGRGLYRRTILGCGDISGVLDRILEKHGAADFGGAVEFLMRAVGADLSAATPSTDKRDLESMNTDLYHLRALANFTREFGADIDALRSASGKAPLPEAGVDALRILCKAKNERFVMLDALSGALGLARERDPEYDVHALTKAFTLAHSLPEKLFADRDARQRVLAAAQKMLDAAIDLEESLLTEEE